MTGFVALPIRSISQLTSAIKRTLNESFDDVWVRG